MPYREGEPARGGTWEKLFVAHGDGPLLWSRRGWRPSPELRGLVGVALVLLALMPAAAPVLVYVASVRGEAPLFVQSVPLTMFMSVGAMLWLIADFRLIFSRERLEGMRFMNETVAIDENVEIDGLPIGSPKQIRAALFRFVDNVRGARGSSLHERVRWSVGLVHDKTVYELTRTSGDAPAHDAAEKLRLALGSAAAIVEGDAGSQPFTDETHGGASLSGFLGVLAPVAAWLRWGVPPLWLVAALAGLAVLARVSLEIVRLSKCSGIQPESFRSRFAGAEPVAPLPWLTEPRARRFRLIVHLALAAASVGGCVYHPLHTPPV